MTQSASKHFIKFYIKRAKASPMQFAEYRADMVMGILGTDGYTGIMVAFIRVIYSKTQTIGGWGKYEMLLLFATGQFVVYIFWCFFRPLQGKLSDLIKDGDLDLYLNKPINTFLNVVSSSFNLVESLPSVALAVAMFGFVFQRPGLNFESIMLLAIPSAIVNCGIMVGLYAVTALAAFWLTDTRDLASIQGSLLLTTNCIGDSFESGKNNVA